MDGYQVDVGELKFAENLVRELGANFATSASIKYSVVPREVGNEELAQALAEFHDHSRRAANSLCADAVEAATRLRDTAAEYQRHDQESAHLIAGGMLVDPANG